MHKHIYLILAATFILGFVSGGVLFLNNNTGKEGDGDIRVDEEVFVITAHTYGGCERGGQCASYRIEDGKTYTYIVRGIDGATVRTSGELSREKQRTLTTRVEETDFRALTTPFVGECATVTDGNAYRYTIIKSESEYTFDSCEIHLADTPLFDQLEEYFTYFNETHSAEND